jgi:8-oxo-dGTP diphosphatase
MQMKTAAMGIVVRNKEILLVKRRFPPLVWSPPGGFIDLGEIPEETVRRETWEETGIVCNVLNQIHSLIYNNYSHIKVYACQYISGSPKISYESIDIGWFDISKLPSPISPEIEVFKKAVECVSVNNL